MKCEEKKLLMLCMGDLFQNHEIGEKKQKKRGVLYKCLIKIITFEKPLMFCMGDLYQNHEMGKTLVLCMAVCYQDHDM